MPMLICRSGRDQTEGVWWACGLELRHWKVTVKREGEKESKTKLSLRHAIPSFTHCAVSAKERREESSRAIFILSSVVWNYCLQWGLLWKEQWKGRESLLGEVFLGKVSAWIKCDTGHGWSPFRSWSVSSACDTWSSGSHLGAMRKQAWGQEPTPWKYERKKRNQTGSCWCCWVASLMDLGTWKVFQTIRNQIIYFLTVEERYQ